MSEQLDQVKQELHEIERQRSELARRYRLKSLEYERLKKNELQSIVGKCYIAGAEIYLIIGVPEGEETKTCRDFNGHQWPAVCINHLGSTFDERVCERTFFDGYVTGRGCTCKAEEVEPQIFFKHLEQEVVRLYDICGEAAARRSPTPKSET